MTLLIEYKFFRQNFRLVLFKSFNPTFIYKEKRKEDFLNAV